MQSKLALVISSFMLVAMSAESVAQSKMSSRHQGQGTYVNNNNNANNNNANNNNANNNNANNNNANNNNPINNNPNNVPISISFAGLSSPQIGGTVDLSALASGGDGSNVAYSAGPGGVCSLSGATLTINGPGTCTVSVTQAGNTANASLTVNALVNPVTFAISGSWFNQVLTFSQATSLSGGTAQYESVDTRVCTIAGTTVTAKAIGECRIRATVAASGNYAEGFEEASIMVSESDLPPECTIVVAGGCGPGYTQADGAFFESQACSNVSWSFTDRQYGAAVIYSSDVQFAINSGVTQLNWTRDGFLSRVQQRLSYIYPAQYGDTGTVCQRNP